MDLYLRQTESGERQRKMGRGGGEEGGERRQNLLQTEACRESDRHRDADRD